MRALYKKVSYEYNDLQHWVLGTHYAVRGICYLVGERETTWPSALFRRPRFFLLWKTQSVLNDAATRPHRSAATTAGRRGNSFNTNHRYNNIMIIMTQRQTTDRSDKQNLQQQRGGDIYSGILTGRHGEITLRALPHYPLLKRCLTYQI